MNRDRFWLTEEQFSRIAPHFRTFLSDKRRYDPMRYLVSLDFWLWIGVWMSVSLMAVAMRPLDWMS